VESPVEVAAGRRSSSGASARQLGATLWEIQDVVRAAGAGRRIRRRARRAVAASPSRRDGDDGDADRVRKSAFFFGQRGDGGSQLLSVVFHFHLFLRTSLSLDFRWITALISWSCPLI
jgi:hypothetical protein